MYQETEYENITGRDLVAKLLEQKKLPENGWKSPTIKHLLSYLSSLDSNNFTYKASVGEREGRCISDLVAARNFYFTHGIGRSGDLTEPQPKAIGSSILYKLTNILLSDLMTIYNLDLKCLLAPIPIGISLILCLSTFRRLRNFAEYVIWFRDDNEIVFKSIVNGGFIPIILNPQYSSDGNNFQFLEEKINEIGMEKINCIISTTPCTLPRISDDIGKIFKVCHRYSIPHLVINHYGLQSKCAMSSFNRPHEDGEIEVILHNASGNLLVPIGSTLITSWSSNTLENIAKAYPGRASSSSTIDILISLLSFGKQGYIKLLDDKELLFKHLREGIMKLFEKYRFLTKLDYNSTSLAIYLSKNIKNFNKLNELVHFERSIATLLVPIREDKIILNHKFEGWGTHGMNYTSPCLVFPLSLYTSQIEIDILLKNIDSCLNKIQVLFFD